MRDGLIFGGIEAGGTKFVCMAGRGPSDVLAETRFETTTPEQTLAQAIEFFQPFTEGRRLGALGIGTFGPCDLDPNSPTYGFITSTPKPGWQNTDIMGILGRGLDVKAIIDTDVNAAAVGELTWGATVGTNSSLYLTIGTGIGGGLMIDGKPVHGLQHPEMGHVFVPHDRAQDPFPGSCPFHGDCFEGLASGPAIHQRFGRPGEALTTDDPFWELEAEYIAAAVSTYILVTSPARIVIGGGIMERSSLLPRVRKIVVRSLAGYIRHPSVTSDIENYLVAPGLGSRSGVLGAVALASGLHRLDRQ